MKIVFSLLLLSIFAISMAQESVDNNNPKEAKYIVNLMNYCSGDNEFNNYGSTLSDIPKPNCWDNSGLSDVWFKFTAVGSFVDIKISGNTLNNNGTLEKPQIAIYESNNNFENYKLICNKLITKGNDAEFVNYDLTVGFVYYIRVSAANEGTFKFCFTNYIPPPFPGPDCNSAAVLSDENLIFAPPSFKGAGNDNNEAEYTCLDVGQSPVEKNTIWYKWTCSNDGNLAFTITPNNPNDDLDFVLFKLPSMNDCENRVSIRCMASAETGPTGLSFSSEDTYENPGFSDYSVNPPIIHDNFVKYVSMSKGETYALMIENFTKYLEGEPSGFTIGFDGDLAFTGPKAFFEISDTLFCNPGQTITVSNKSTDANRYQWYFGNDSDKPSPMSSMTQIPLDVKYSDYGIKQIILRAWQNLNPNEVHAYSRLVYIIPTPELTVSQDTNLCDGTPVRLSAKCNDPIATYLWSNGEGFNEIYVTEPNTYTVTAYDRYNCSNNSEIVLEPCELPKDSIQLSNIITPNADGVNDKFEIKNLEQYPNTKLIVIDRWGKTVFESNDYKNDWDAKNNAGGTYFYFLEMEDGLKHKGILTILK